MPNIDYYEWYSHRINKNMGVVRYGHWGPPLIYFPTCGGNHGEFSYYGLQNDLRWFLDSGKIQIFCVDSTNMETWYNPYIHPADRVNGGAAYESYIIEEVIPLIRNLAHNDYIGCAGFSLGGYTSINMACRHPEIFRLAISLGGVFDISDFLDGWHNDDVYFRNPVEYIANMHEQWQQDCYRYHNRLILLGGANDPFVSSTIGLHNLLNRQGIVHHYEIWDPPCDHHEYWWKKQMPYLLGKFYM